MYKVLIVDDEKYVISLIEKLIDWEKLGMKVVGSAGDGMKGVELVEELKPDILIADVKMPGFDGISLVKRVREIDRDIKFIIISGHKKFEYAKSVMKYNVEDYILKPIDKEELEGILQKISKELDEKSEQRKNEGKINKWMDSNRLLMNDQFMEELYNKSLFSKKQSIEEINQRYFTELGNYVYRCAIIQLNGLNGTMEASFVEDFLSTLKKYIDQKNGENERPVMSRIGYHQILLLLESAQEKMSSVNTVLEHILGEALRMGSKYSGLKVAFSVGKPVRLDTNVMGLEETLDSARTALNKRFTDGYGRILLAENNRAAENSDIDADMLKNLGKAVRSTSESEITQQINAIYDAIRSEGYKNSNIYMTAACKVNEELYQYLRLFSSAEGMQQKLEEQLGKRMIEATGITELKKLLVQHICENMEQLIGDSKSNLSPAIRTAKIFIANNYKQDIGLGDVARVVNLSSVYFSGLFKKEMGENFVDYLNRVRIDAAKVLLKDVRNNIGEIAEQCGFSDTRYFAKIFKRSVGITPSDYRKRQID
ncbi:response regulator [Clostridiaceae bacterium Marseille-Q4145]|nr:response regulator [Clostridiaceae bacterium Marseille-Q4145]